MDQIERTKQFFNKPLPGTPRKIASPVDVHVFESICKLLPRGSDQEFAVDLGCHWGRYTKRLAESYGRVVGIDFAAEAIATAAAGPNIRYLALDLERDGLALERKVDFFLAVGLFEMLKTPGLVAEKMGKHSSSGGGALIVMPNKRHLNFIFLRFVLWIARNLLRRKEVYIYHNGITPEQLLRPLLDAGYEFIDGGSIVGMPPSVVARLPGPVQKLLLKRDRLATVVFGGAYHWLYLRKQ
jgi:2-polyprenyl-3-methyl-5-hydroxy-6-metoxy-1,4-benzoquinol methylase